MKTIIPAKLQPGDEIRIMAPSFSLACVPKNIQKRAEKCLMRMGYRVSYGVNVQRCGFFRSASIEEKIFDLNQAFRDSKVKMIITALGGYNANQLLPYLDYKLIRKNPKILIGFSDITALINAIYARTGIITYHGPGFSLLGNSDYGYIKKAFRDNFIELNQICLQWQKNRSAAREQPWVIQSGVAEGVSIGGNLCTLNLLQGTLYFPSLKNSIVFIEDDPLIEDFDLEFERNLESLLQQKDADMINGLIIGRFMKKCRMSNDKLKKIIQSKKMLQGKPVVANVAFGHPTPHYIFPIGARMRLAATPQETCITIAAR